LKRRLAKGKKLTRAEGAGIGGQKEKSLVEDRLAPAGSFRTKTKSTKKHVETVS